MFKLNNSWVIFVTACLAYVNCQVIDAVVRHHTDNGRIAYNTCMGTLWLNDIDTRQFHNIMINMFGGNFAWAAQQYVQNSTGLAIINSGNTTAVTPSSNVVNATCVYDHSQVYIPDNAFWALVTNYTYDYQAEGISSGMLSERSHCTSGLPIVAKMLFNKVAKLDKPIDFLYGYNAETALAMSKTFMAGLFSSPIDVYSTDSCYWRIDNFQTYSGLKLSEASMLSMLKKLQCGSVAMCTRFEVSTSEGWSWWADVVTGTDYDSVAGLSCKHYVTHEQVVESGCS